MNKQVVYAKLHGTDAFIPGLGSLGSTLPPKSKSFPFQMFYTEYGLRLEINAGQVVAMIPLANVQVAVLAPEPASEAPKAPTKAK